MPRAASLLKADSRPSAGTMIFSSCSAWPWCRSFLIEVPIVPALEQESPRDAASGLVPHAAHPAGCAGNCGRVLLRGVRDDRLGGDEKGGDGAGVLESGAHDLGRIDDA